MCVMDVFQYYYIFGKLIVIFKLYSPISICMYLELYEDESSEMRLLY